MSIRVGPGYRASDSRVALNKLCLCPWAKIRNSIICKMCKLTLTFAILASVSLTIDENLFSQSIITNFIYLPAIVAAACILGGFTVENQ